MAMTEHEKSRRLWGDMAAGWERNRDYMWEMTHHVAEWLVDQAEVREGDTVLDLAGGPGEMGLLLADRVGDSGRVIETDFAPEMVEVASRRTAGRANVETRVLDAQRMDLADDEVDAIACRWGFMLMMDPAQALRECRRVLKDGRRLTFSVWGTPDKNPWVTVPGMTMAQLGYPPARDPFGPGGMFSMAEPDTIRKLLSDAGFETVTIEEMPVHWPHASFEDGWSFMTQVAGAIATAIKEMPEERVQELRAKLEENMQEFRTGDGALDLPGVTVNVAAT